jgi:hypothetical protein
MQEGIDLLTVACLRSRPIVGGKGSGAPDRAVARIVGDYDFNSIVLRRCVYGNQLCSAHNRAVNYFSECELHLKRVPECLDRRSVFVPFKVASAATGNASHHFDRELEHIPDVEAAAQRFPIATLAWNPAYGMRSHFDAFDGEFKTPARTSIV